MTTPALGGKWEGRRLLAIITIMAVVAALFVIFSGTARAEHVNTWPFSSAANEADYWEDWGETEEGEDDWTCVKLDDQGSDGTYTLGDPPAGNEWRLLIVKKASGDEANSLYWNPVSGGEYEAVTGEGYSHIIGCYRPEDEETTTTSTTLVETTVTTEGTTSSSSSMPTSSSSSVADSTSTSQGDTSTSATVENTTVTSGDSTSSTAGETSTSATVEGTVVTTSPTVDADDLPFTGLDSEVLIGLAVVLLGLGAALLTMTRRVSE